MKIPEIKRLVSAHTIAELSAAEESILEGQKPAIDIIGDDEGEQLTHAIAAREVLTTIEKENLSPALALRNYSKRVRGSIS